MGGGFMESRSLAGCQKWHCEIWCDCHLSGCYQRIQRECSIVRVY